MHWSLGDTFVPWPLRLPCNAFLAAHRARDILPSKRTTRPSATGSEIHVRGEEERGCWQKGARTRGPPGQRGCTGFQSKFFFSIWNISISFVLFYLFRYFRRKYFNIYINKSSRDKYIRYTVSFRCSVKHHFSCTRGFREKVSILLDTVFYIF